MKFEILDLKPEILKGIQDAGFEHCTPIQEQSLPECLAGKDVIAQSQTGSGKTAVFLLTIFSRLSAAKPGDSGKPRALPLDNIEIFVIDEADRMFDMGFAPDIMYIAGQMPKKKPRQTMLFSATIDDNVRNLAPRYMKPDPAMIQKEPDQVTVNTIDQKVIYVSNEEQLPMQ